MGLPRLSRCTFREQVRAGFRTRPLCNAFGQVISNGALVTTSALHWKLQFLFNPRPRTQRASCQLDRTFPGRLAAQTAYLRPRAGLPPDAGRRWCPAIQRPNFSLTYAVLSRNRLPTFVQSFVYELHSARSNHLLGRRGVFASWVIGGVSRHRYAE